MKQWDPEPDAHRVLNKCKLNEQMVEIYFLLPRGPGLLMCGHHHPKPLGWGGEESQPASGLRSPDCAWTCGPFLVWPRCSCLLPLKQVNCFREWQVAPLSLKIETVPSAQSDLVGKNWFHASLSVIVLEHQSTLSACLRGLSVRAAVTAVQGAQWGAFRRREILDL